MQPDHPEYFETENVLNRANLLYNRNRIQKEVKLLDEKVYHPKNLNLKRLYELSEGKLNS